MKLNSVVHKIKNDHKWYYAVERQVSQKYLYLVHDFVRSEIYFHRDLFDIQVIVHGELKLDIWKGK